MDTKLTIVDLIQAKKQGQKIAAVSCYDFITASIVAQTNIQMVLVGDSASQLILGHDSTLPVRMDFMVDITAAVRRGAPNVCLVADMPFLSYQVSIPEAIKNAGRFVVEAGAQIIKIEATSAQLNVIKAVSDAGMSVMAHIGMKPQTIAKIGKFKSEGSTAEIAAEIIDLAQQMVNAGASSLLLEGVVTEVAEIITKNTEAPVISCGSGPHCDGQILVAPDILGLTSGKGPKFVKKYANLAQDTLGALKDYAKEISDGIFPTDEHCYHIKSGELEKLKSMLKDKT
ncbi:MAG: 3-methyl-2-oxobutanoate hydroxymethyltransferase [Sedimentisphaerales bacterium]|nr:3-methyl-2-oxobutanoate hydroxymethyltransferase [Sedimentisphaerales bacterium]